MFKSFVVTTGAGDRIKRDLAQAVDEQVKSFLASEDATLRDFRVEADVGAGGFGSAFVTVFYEEGEKKKKK